ncbi:hypothetical protein FOXG_19649 [Fusarium oxysporum f. sp. lycopersici 4287]|uniref:Uncharacterized protein n=1 Tax=Fusarium oxysporum f. sp. lycopersici (strain 4287 / CBS 123668 / FGSC 9935 / NRRL 34936) TaxID=426428 RepID=A0A0J9V686_FUSO4|nr:hypothetical protein FOXG_19649 [Fusarium oxysporum f. sp. lycopersici 4287]KNB06366.1 hypothetical protein FOXG_19649 [Fusarium oxysporum f. sp. lycopersici 4287]
MTKSKYTKAKSNIQISSIENFHLFPDAIFLDKKSLALDEALHILD